MSDLVDWAKENNLSFDEFCEEVFNGAIALGALVLEKSENDQTTFKYSQVEKGDTWELYIRKVENPKIIQPKEKTIITNGANSQAKNKTDDPKM